MMSNIIERKNKESLMQNSTVIITENLDKTYPLGFTILKALDKINL